MYKPLRSPDRPAADVSSSRRGSALQLFLSLPGCVQYADLLQEKLKKHGTHVFLINTGWSGGPCGEGKRMSIKATRACIDAVLNGSIHNAETRVDDRFGFRVPTTLEGVPTQLLTPKATWAHPVSRCGVL